MPAADQVIDARQAPYLAAFETLANEGPTWLREIRRTAVDRFIELGFPTTHDEEWRFTNIAPLAGVSFDPPPDFDDSARAAELIRAFPADEHRLVFINGRFSPVLSRLSVRNGLTVASLRDSLASSEVDQRLARYADYRHHAFVALNTAFVEDGAFVYVKSGVVVDDPIHLVHVAIPGQRPHVSHPRNLIVLGARSQASLIETYIGSDRYFTNAVTEIAGGEESVIDHYKLQQESSSAFHIATMQVHQERGCVFRSHSFSLGGALARNGINAVLSEGSECTLNGLYIVGGRQHIDTHTSIDHAKPQASSHELYKGILNGEASAVFNGKIIVRKDAQKTDAKQTNKNLVLSEGSTINTKPELQIHADDVRCTHGATIGQLDEEAIFYLRSRGIGRDDARAILTQAFAREIIDGIRVESLRSYLEGMLP